MWGGAVNGPEQLAVVQSAALAVPMGCSGIGADFIVLAAVLGVWPFGAFGLL